MKISLNWIFDHIKGDVAGVDVRQLVNKFICTTAEIEAWRKVTLSTDTLTLAQVKSVASDAITVYCYEHAKEYVLPKRNDAAVGACVMIAHNGANAQWATSVMLGGTKDMLLPVLDVAEHLRTGGWKSAVELDDYIIEVDNKSINNRPDLWGHRGLAREIAALLNAELRPLDDLVVQKDIVTHQSLAQPTRDNPFEITIQDPQVCDRFAALYIPSVTPKASQLNMVIRLSRLDSRAIDLLVDITNYVMLDLGQPMHAFDADALQSKKITVHQAQEGNKLLLLDGETITLTAHDIVIADGGMPVSLAGIMGGAQTGISPLTQSILLESAHFDATTIRRSSARHKKRTEASMRFEKNLDPHQNVDAITRYLFLLNAANVVYKTSHSIISLGNVPQPKTITVQHAFIESRLGIIIKPERVVTILEKIGFNVTQSIEDEEIEYNILVPTFRATKDVKIPEDIVEEVGRYIGYDSLPRVMPAIQLRPSDLHAAYTTRALKKFLSYGLMMHELYGYSFFDESVLRDLAWQPTNFVEITNPVSENYTRLLTTLQPHLLKAVADNSIHHSALRFYEWGRVWHMHGDDIVEQKSLSGILFSPEMDFYAGKALLVRMFDLIHMDFTWKPYEKVDYPWLSAHQTATLMHDSKIIGVAGMVDESVKPYLSATNGAAFIFELNADYLLHYKRPLVRFEPLSKYPTVRRDVSMLISAEISADALMALIKEIDQRIQEVTLIDFFSKPEWKDKKAITLHVQLCDKEKTLVADEVEQIWARVIAQLQQQGAVIR